MVPGENLADPGQLRRNREGIKLRSASNGTRELFVKWRDYAANYTLLIKEQDLIV